mmetsp:Transcript_23249/g.72397  ORF Transcript_23249/g.72397 Transcript_23249/m.72397 type:complete len:489 (+) Transcript_23249:22-1488(+)
MREGEEEDDEPSKMQGFIRSQMLSIMQPVAEHVREVQGQVQQLVKRLQATDGRVDENRVALDQQHQDLLATRKGLAQTDGHVEKLQSDLGMTHREKERLDSDHEVTKSDLAKIAGNLRTSNVLLKAMQQKCEDLDSDVRSLQMGTAKMGRSLVEEAEKSTQTREFAEGLNARHLDMVKNINELARTSADNQRGLHKLSQQCDKNNGSVKSELSRQQQHIDSLEERLGSAQQELQANMDKIKGVDSQLRWLRSSLNSDDGSGRTSMDSLQNRLERSDTHMKEHDDMMDGLKLSLNALQKLFHSHQDDLSSTVKDLEHRVGNNTTHLEGLEAAKEKTQENLKKHEIGLTKSSQALDALSGHVDMLQLDFRGLHAAQTDLANKVEVNRVSLTQTQSDLQHTSATVDTTNGSLLQLKDGLAAMDMTISKLGSRYDTCTRNIQGMSKGLADVSKHVSQGDHGLLPPKSPHSRRLPSLHSGGGGTQPNALQSAV